MKTRLVAALGLAVLCPAALFMAAVVLRELTALPLGAAHTAERVVDWYAGRIWTLWVLLLALPFTVLVSGSLTLRRDWKSGAKLLPSAANLATFLVAGTTLAAAVILCIVVLHMAAN